MINTQHNIYCNNYNLTLISDPSDQLECLLRVIDECIILKDYIEKYYIILYYGH